jgi:hypothetical protein
MGGERRFPAKEQCGHHRFHGRLGSFPALPNEPDQPGPALGNRIARQQIASLGVFQLDLHQQKPLPRSRHDTGIEALQRSIDVQRDLGFLKSKIDIKAYTDLSYVKQGAARLR